MKKKVIAMSVCLVFLFMLTLGAVCSPGADPGPGEEGTGSNSEEETGEENGAAEGNQVQDQASCPFPEGLVLPQVWIIARGVYTQADLDALETNVVEPLIAYFESEGQTVVSIEIDSDNRYSAEKSYFLVSVIVSMNNGTRDAGNMGFIHEKVDGEIPVWEMTTMD